MSAQAKGLAALLAAHGRNGDDELVHMNKREVAALERLGRQHGIETTTNPHTGLKEAFRWQSALGGVLGGIGGVFAAPFTGGVINPYTGAALGSAAGAKLSGASNQDALTTGLISGVTAWGMGGVSDALASAGQEAVKTGVEEGVKTGVEEGIKTGVTDATASQLPGAAGSFGDTGAAVVGAPTDLAGASGLPTGAAPVTTAVAPPAQIAPGVEAFAKPDAGAMASIDPGYYGAENIGSQGVNTYTSQGTKEMVAAGANPNVTSSIGPGQNTLSASGTNADYWANVNKGIGSLNTPGKIGEFAVANKGNLIASGTGLAMAAAPEEGTTTQDTTPSYGPMPQVEMYTTPYGERRTRIVNSGYARGGSIYGDYDGVEEAADGGYIPGGGLNYAGGGIAGTGWGEQTRGGFSGLTESLQPGGALGEWHGKLYGALGADQIMPGGAVGSLIPGANQYNAKKREEEEQRKLEEEAAIAKAARDAELAKLATPKMAASGGLMGYAPGGDVIYTSPNQVGPYRGEAFRDDQGTLRTRAVDMTPQSSSMPTNWEQAFDNLGGLLGIIQKRKRAAELGSDGYGDGMASGGVANLGYYSDGGQLLRGPGDGVSDSIPASIEGRRPARLADGEFVIPARAVSELGNGSTEAGSKQLYAMLDRIAKKRKKGNGLAYQANPKKLMPV